ncbi:MAG: class I SAM-dependent methyltransferase [Fimbriimonadales bacterium]
MDIKPLHEDNRKGWNEGAEAYEKELDRWIEFLRNGGENFEPPELAYLQDLDKWCQRAIHLQCAGGTDTLSLWNHGAHEVIGVDISDRMIEVARRKAEAIGANAKWYRSDILETPHELDGTADLVYTGRGAICWIHDLRAWADVVVRLLKPGGKLYIFEGHPITFLWDCTASDYRLDPLYGDYFSDRVFSEQGWPDTYIGDLGKPAEEHAVKHERNWRLGDIVTALSDAGLRFLKLEEHPDSFWNGNPNMPPDTLRKSPQTFSLLMMKP